MYEISLILNIEFEYAWFRSYIADAAKRYNISGNVRWLTDTSYEVRVKGSAKQINEFMDWCNSFDGGKVTEYKLKYKQV